MRRTPRTDAVQAPGPVQGIGLGSAIAYIRVSTEEQARQGVSLGAQEARIRAYCAFAGLEIKKMVREEGISGTKPLFERPAGGDLTKLGKTGVRHVVALKLDRLFRSALNALNVAAEWDKAGIALHIVDMGGQAMNTSSATGRYFFTMLAAFAELERNLISERTATALAHLKATGRVYGAIPYGSVGLEGKLIADAGEVATLKLIAKLRLGGMPLRTIAAKLNRDKVSCKRGGRKWYASTVRSVLNQARQPSGKKAATA